MAGDALFITQILNGLTQGFVAGSKQARADKLDQEKLTLSERKLDVAETGAEQQGRLTELQIKKAQQDLDGVGVTRIPGLDFNPETGEVLSVSGELVTPEERKIQETNQKILSKQQLQRSQESAAEIKRERSARKEQENKTARTTFFGEATSKSNAVEINKSFEDALKTARGVKKLEQLVDRALLTKGKITQEAAIAVQETANLILAQKGALGGGVLSNQDLLFLERMAANVVQLRELPAQSRAKLKNLIRRTKAILVDKILIRSVGLTKEDISSKLDFFETGINPLTGDKFLGIKGLITGRDETETALFNLQIDADDLKAEFKNTATSPDRRQQIEFEEVPAMNLLKKQLLGE